MRIFLQHSASSDNMSPWNVFAVCCSMFPPDPSACSANIDIMIITMVCMQAIEVDGCISYKMTAAIKFVVYSAIPVYENLMHLFTRLCRVQCISITDST